MKNTSYSYINPNKTRNTTIRNTGFPNRMIYDALTHKHESYCKKNFSCLSGVAQASGLLTVLKQQTSLKGSSNDTYKTALCQNWFVFLVTRLVNEII